MATRPIKSMKFHHFSSVDHFCKSWTPEIVGPICIDDNLPILLNWEHKDSAHTVICFSAASQKIRELPFWSGRSLVSGLDANVILVSDPSLSLDRTLNLAWYAGSQQQPHLIAKLTHIFKAMVRDTTAVFFGASAGGWAALTYAAEFEDAIAVPVNPQIDISRYLYFPYYTRKAWGAEPDSVELPFERNVSNRYSSDNVPTVIYIQNRGDTHHYEQHFLPFEQKHGSPDRLIALTPELGQGHIAPDRNSLQTVLKLVTGSSDLDKLTYSLRQVHLRSSGVDKETKVEDLKNSRDSLDERYPILSEQSFSIPDNAESFSIGTKATLSLAPKTLLFEVRFVGSRISPATVKQLGLSWSQAFRSPFQYSPAVENREWVDGKAIKIPEDTREILLTIRKWNTSALRSAANFDTRLSFHTTATSGTIASS